MAEALHKWISHRERSRWGAVACTILKFRLFDSLPYEAQGEGWMRWKSFGQDELSTQARTMATGRKARTSPSWLNRFILR